MSRFPQSSVVSWSNTPVKTPLLSACTVLASPSIPLARQYRAHRVEQLHHRWHTAFDKSLEQKLGTHRTMNEPKTDLLLWGRTRLRSDFVSVESSDRTSPHLLPRPPQACIPEETLSTDHQRASRPLTSRHKPKPTGTHFGSHPAPNSVF